MGFSILPSQPEFFLDPVILRVSISLMPLHVIFSNVSVNCDLATEIHRQQTQALTPSPRFNCLSVTLSTKMMTLCICFTIRFQWGTQIGQSMRVFLVAHFFSFYLFCLHCAAAPTFPIFLKLCKLTMIRWVLCWSETGQHQITRFSLVFSLRILIWLFCVSPKYESWLAWFDIYLHKLFMLSSNNTDQCKMWILIHSSFLNQQIEREISFRTESGLYFSYYKQIVLAPSLSQGKQKIVGDQCNVWTL